MEIAANIVKELREKTGAGFMECKKALTESSGDLEKAVEYLRKKGIATAEKKSGRAANDGLVTSYIHSNGKVGVLLEVNCETDFVAKTNEFQAFVKDIAMQVAAAHPRYLSREEVPTVDLEKEKEILREQMKNEKKPANILDKIVEGKVNKFYEDTCLIDQRFIKDDSKTVKQLLTDLIAKLGENIVIKRFARFQLGETK